MKPTHTQVVAGGAFILWPLVSGCQHNPRPSDITGFVVSIDTSSKMRRVRVEADTTDSVATGRGSPKALIQFSPSISLAEMKVGCVVQVWYDERYPILDSYPIQVVGKSAEVVRCP